VILERIDKHNLVIQGFENCTTLQPEDLLRELRNEFPKSEIQLFRADHVAGKEHIVFAANGAVRAFRQHQERARTLAVELLLYMSCQRQISKAIQRLGVGPRTSEVVLAAFTADDTAGPLAERIAKKLKATPNDEVIEIQSKKKTTELMRTYDITPREIESARITGEDDNSTLMRLVIERGALLTVEK
jgi:KEOPS complex subunit Cgi121